jgi:hypothetical protein
MEGNARSLLGFNAKFRIAVHASQLVIDVETEGNTDLPTLRNFAADIVRPLVDLISYRTGGGFEVEIISATNKETNEWAVFGTEIPVLAQARMQRDRERGVQRHESGAQQHEISAAHLQAITGDVYSQIVLANFRAAMRVPVETGFYCYRAIEAMMQSMKSGPNDTDEAAWEKLRETLKIERDIIDSVKQHADLPRHGKPSVITDEERARVFQATDKIIERYLDYLVQKTNP